MVFKQVKSGKIDREIYLIIRLFILSNRQIDYLFCLLKSILFKFCLPVANFLKL